MVEGVTLKWSLICVCDALKNNFTNMSHVLFILVNEFLNKQQFINLNVTINMI